MSGLKCEAGEDVVAVSGKPTIVYCGRPGHLVEGGLVPFVLCDLHEHLVVEWSKRAVTMLEEAKRRKRGEK